MCLAPRQYYVTLLLLGSLALLATGCMPSERDREFARFDALAAQTAAGKGGYFNFYDIHHTDELLRKHAGLHGLKYISFSVTTISDSGVAELPKYPDLEELVLYELGESRLRDSWLETLKACPKLKSMEITEWRSPTFTVAKVLELPHLRKLRIDVAEVPEIDRWIDESIVALRGAQQLAELGLGGEFYKRRKELVELRRALPNCRMVLTSRKSSSDDIPIEP